MKTRDRIIEQARLLFNEQGYGNVTTAGLAQHLSMAEGNLWYHFKTKRALIEAIAERFETTIEARLALMPGADPVASYTAFLAALMDEFRAFRFIYRDQPSYGEHVDLIARQAPDWISRTFAQIEAHLAALVDAGLLDWPRQELRDLSINATILLRYGLEHYRELGIPTGAGSGAVRRALLRHLTLFQHRLDPAAAQQLTAASERIEQTALAA